MTLEMMKQLKADYGYSCEHIADMSGVPVSTVRKVFGGKTEHPRYETMKALNRFFTGGTDNHRYEYVLKGNKLMVAEPPTYGRGSEARQDFSEDLIRTIDDLEPEITIDNSRRYSIEDYEKLPDEPRVEIIDGHLFLMEAPSLWHQKIAGAIFAQVWNYIRDKKKPCQVYIAPTDVKLMVEDDHTMVQPDILVVCDKDKERDKRRIIGAPEWVVEILSPSTRKKDMQIKRKKYEEAGVREYWMVDLKAQIVHAIEFEKKSLIHMFSFSESMPVAMTGGDLKIDLSEFEEQELEE